MTLDPVDYWRLRAATADVERDQVALVLAQARVEMSRRQRQAVWSAIATKYGLDAERAFAARDEDCSLNEVSS